VSYHLNKLIDVVTLWYRWQRAGSRWYADRLDKNFNVDRGLLTDGIVNDGSTVLLCVSVISYSGHVWQLILLRW